ncbi:MAG: alpha/beta fold hydrolase [Spongiibacteraceae bacterium]
MREQSMTVPLFYRESFERESSAGIDDGAVPVLLLHGLFGAGDNLGSLARQLAATRRVLQIDLRNHGQSPHAEHMDLPIMAKDLQALIQSLDITRCDIVGHSLGGKVAMQLAMNRAECVRRLIVADIAPVSYGPGHDQVFAALAAVDLPAVQSRRDADAMMAPFLDEAVLRQFLLKSLYRDDTGYHWRFDLATIKADYDALRAAPTGDPFPGPTLFIKGELSDYITGAQEPALRALFPAYRLQTIPGAGHWVHGEQPALFNSLVEEFLA